MRRGFTLIEVMVVLSILAIIAILAYNFFGSTMREAVAVKNAAQIYKQIQSISAAYDEYERRTGSEYDLSVWTQVAPFKADVVSLGILREFPEIDASLRSTTVTCTQGFAPGALGWGFHEVSNYSAGPGNETALYAYCVESETCKAFNEKYTDLGSTIPLTYADLELRGGAICAKGAYTPDEENLVLAIVRAR